ncbi:MAG: MFS transporter [Clostridiales bacterium]|nr:MFS transporter [Clostridiales bacterium]HBM81758.1 hypothetical protein [Clostridiaceae bacterium]
MNSKLLLKMQKRIFILCWIAYSLSYFCRVNISIALPYIQKMLECSNAALGFLGSSLFIVYAAGQLINGYIGDRVESRKFVFIGLAFSALINIFFGFAKSLPLMIILWGVNGFFQSMLWGPIMKNLSCWFPSREKNKIAIKISTTMVAGYIMAWGLSGIIITRTSWQWAFFVPGIIVMSFAVLWYIMARNRPEEVGLTLEDDSRPKEKSIDNKQPMTLWQVICSTKLLFVMIACIVQGFVRDGITLWSPKFLMETQKIPVKIMASLVVVIPAANFLGVLLAGWLNNKSNNDEKLASIIMFSAGAIFCIGLFEFGGISPYVCLFFLCCSSALMSGANTLLVSIIPLSYIKYNRVSAIAGLLDFCCYIGSGTTGILTGFIVDKSGWTGVMLSWIIAALIGVLSISAAWIEQKGLVRKRLETSEIK